MTVSLRAATPDDLETLVQLENQCFADAWSRSTLRAALEDANSFTLLAQCGDAICGYAMAWSLWDEGELTNLAVAPNARGQGIGAMLLQAILDECKNRGATSVLLEVRDDNDAAQRLYARFGFIQVGLRRDYYGPGADAIVMKTERV